MKTFKVISNSAYDEHSPITYWIEERSKIFFGIFSRRKILGDYKFDNGGAMSEMPFFELERALERVELLKKNL